ncbi:MAG TPA: hypothetical protein VGM98_16250 [Schlesneria sp.]|jgi:hypothetical protein
MADDAEGMEDLTNLKVDENLFKIHYVKSAQFRVIHVDGMVGGVTPSGEGIELALFSERLPIPKFTVNRITGEDGSYEEVDTIGREGVIREVDINAIMSAETAEKLGTWLLEQAVTVRELREE